MTTLKVGDHIIGRASANGEYGVTVEGWIGNIVEIHKDGEHIDISAPGDHTIHTVEAKHFQLVNPLTKAPKTGLKNLAAASKALRRKGPKSEFEIHIDLPIRIQAAGTEEDAQELLLETIKESFLNNLHVNYSRLTIKGIQKL